jgi:hypothetical protein
MKGIVILTLLITILATIMAEGAMTAFAEDFQWNLLTDTEAGYRVEDKHSAFDRKTEDDGTVYMQNKGVKSGALYIYDDNNILGTYRSFTLEGDFYFDAFPGGPLRDGKYTPEERPLSFLCWIYNSTAPGGSSTFNALRIDSQGYLYTGAGSTDRTETQLSLKTWYNIRCAFLPANGICEVFINGEKAFDFNYTRFNPDKHVSGSVRYFDGYFEWSAKMKNLFVKTDSDYSMELVREASADYYGYQTTKITNGFFDIRFISSIDDMAFSKSGAEVSDTFVSAGYEVIAFWEDENGEVKSNAQSLNSSVI